MDHLIVDGDARGTRETAVSQEGRLGTALFDVVPDFVVNHLSGNAGLDKFAAESESLTGNSAGDPHEFDFFVGFNQYHTRLSEAS